MAITQEQLALGEKIKSQQEASVSKEEDIGMVQSFIGTLARSGLKGLEAFGSAFGPLPPRTGQDISEKEGYGKKIEELIPTRETFIERGIERGAKIAPFALTGGGGVGKSLLQSITGGIAGEGAKEAGFGPVGQALFEAAPSIAPSLAKKIPTSGGEIRSGLSNLANRLGFSKLASKLEKGALAASEQQEIIEFARSQNLPEEQIALLFPDHPDILTSVASKGPGVQRKFEETYKSLNRVWGTLEESPGAQAILSPDRATHYIGKMEEKMKKFPEGMRSKIQQDFRDLISSEKSGSDFMNFWKDLNYYIRKGDSGVGVLKSDIKSALGEISPELAKDFDLTNKMYGGFKGLGKKMAPGVVEGLINAGESAALLSAITERNYPLLKKIAGPIAGRKIAQAFVTNPRLQNLQQRFINGINRGKFVIADKVFNQIIQEIAKTDSETARKLSEFELSEMRSLIEQQSTER